MSGFRMAGTSNTSLGISSDITSLIRNSIDGIRYQGGDYTAPVDYKQTNDNILGSITTVNTSTTNDINSLKSSLGIGRTSNAIIDMRGTTNKGVYFPTLTGNQLRSFVGQSDGAVVYVNTAQSGVEVGLYVYITNAWNKITAV